MRVGHSGAAGGRKEFTRLGRRKRRSSCGLGVGEAERREGCEGAGGLSCGVTGGGRADAGERNSPGWCGCDELGTLLHVYTAAPPFPTPPATAVTPKAVRGKGGPG